MPFRNRIRLPFYVTRPQFPSERNVFRLANGTTKTMSAIIRKVFEGETENLPKEIHERLIIALSHDDVTIEGYRYLGGISIEGDYEIDWNKFLDYPLAKAEFKVQVTPFNFSNDNCQTCEEASQVVCENDFLGTFDDDNSYNVGVIDNDGICCTPFEISIVSYNTDYVDAIVTNFDYRITFHLKSNLQSVNSVTLFRYRVTCENGMYDEADATANINGSNPTPACLAPVNISLLTVSDTTAQMGWNAPDPIPSCGYHWELHLAASPGVLVVDGNLSDTVLDITGLQPSTCYIFNIKSNCCSGNESNYTSNYEFCTNPPPDTQTCGQYNIENFDFSSVHFVTYIDCNGESQEAYVVPGGSRFICALQNGPDDPVQITPSHFDINITYVDLC